MSAGVLREVVDAVAIIVIVILNAVLGFIQEYRAEKSLAALKKLSSPSSKVLRDGQPVQIASEEMVPGDLIELEAGDSVPADSRVVWTTSNFGVQEASLTGESTPVVKTAAALKEKDVALADAYKGGRDAWLQLELRRTMRNMMAQVEKQVFYGVNSDAKGFAGLLDNAQLDALADTMVETASGSNALTQTSVYALRMGEQDVCMVAGNDGRFVVEDEPTIIEKSGTGSGTYPALYVPVTGYLGFQIGGAYSAGRLANVECNSMTSTTALTDDHIAQLLSVFPAARMPNVVVMNRDALRLLRQSRSAYSPTGAPAPFPTEVFGIPIVVTDQILSTEAVES